MNRHHYPPDTRDVVPGHISTAPTGSHKPGRHGLFIEQHGCCECRGGPLNTSALGECQRCFRLVYTEALRARHRR